MLDVTILEKDLLYKCPMLQPQSYKPGPAVQVFTTFIVNLYQTLMAVHWSNVTFHQSVKILGWDDGIDLIGSCHFSTNSSFHPGQLTPWGERSIFCRCAKNWHAFEWLKFLKYPVDMVNTPLDILVFIMPSRFWCYKLQWWYYISTSYRSTLQGINISHLGKRKIIFKMPCCGGYVSRTGKDETLWREGLK